MDGCLLCVEKHIGKAKVYIDEGRAGYTGRYGMAIGELAAAEEEAAKDPNLQGRIRKIRKRFEADRAHYPVPWEWLFGVIESAITQEDIDNRKQAPGDKECGGCKKKRAERAARERVTQKIQEALAQKQALAAREEQQAVLQQDHASSGPLLVLLTTISTWEPSYSLASVILDQARAAAGAGLAVRVVGMADMQLRTCPEIDGVIYESIVPNVIWEEDLIDRDKVDVLKQALETYLRALPKPATILTHDAFLQSWYINLAAAIHGLPEIEGLRWYHQVHSSVGPRPPEDIARYRAALPEGHKLAAINYTDQHRLMAYYQITADRIVHMPNIKDIRSFSHLTPDAQAILDAFPIHEAFVSQVYPLSTPRAEAKGIIHVIDTFAAMKRQDVRVKLLILNAHANGDGPLKVMSRIESYAREQGLTKDEMVWLSDILPERAHAGVDQATVAQLFQLSNVFCFPSFSESCGLVMLEAALGGNLLVLNSSLQVLQEYIPRAEALWASWGSIRDNISAEGSKIASQQVAKEIVIEIYRSRAVAARHTVLTSFNLRRLGQILSRLATS